ncbi:MAG: DUF881 domain-containing protein [Micromonosporaceae bacterium]
MRDWSERVVGWRTALVRAVRPLVPERRPDRVKGWSYVVPVVLFGAGVLFATTAETAQGTELRNDRRVALSELIGERKDEVASLDSRRRRLAREVEAETRRRSGSDSGIRGEQARADSSRLAAGLTAMRGPGLTVRLDDAPVRPDGPLPRGATPDDVVVHQQDVQAVVNALWAGGAEAMSIMGVRVISTSAVRCVGNTLLLHGRVYSPPFTITVIGDTEGMIAALDHSEGVRLYRAAAEDFGLGYTVDVKGEVEVPGYDGTEGLSHARAKR